MRRLVRWRDFAIAIVAVGKPDEIVAVANGHISDTRRLLGNHR